MQAIYNQQYMTAGQQAQYSSQGPRAAQCEAFYGGVWPECFRQDSAQSCTEEEDLLVAFDLFSENAPGCLWDSATLGLDAAAAAALLQDSTTGQIELPPSFSDDDLLPVKEECIIKEDMNVSEQYLAQNADCGWALEEEFVKEEEPEEELSDGSCHSTHGPAVSFHSPYDAAQSPAMITAVQLARAAAIQRYRAKKLRRCHTKHIRYAARKVNADRRPRIKGRFVKREEAAKMMLEQHYDA